MAGIKKLGKAGGEGSESSEKANKRAATLLKAAFDRTALSISKQIADLDYERLHVQEKLSKNAKDNIALYSRLVKQSQKLDDTIGKAANRFKKITLAKDVEKSFKDVTKAAGEYSKELVIQQKLYEDEKKQRQEITRINRQTQKDRTRVNKQEEIARTSYLKESATHNQKLVDDQEKHRRQLNKETESENKRQRQQQKAATTQARKDEEKEQSDFLKSQQKATQRVIDQQESLRMDSIKTVARQEKQAAVEQAGIKRAQIALGNKVFDQEVKSSFVASGKIKEATKSQLSSVKSGYENLFTYLQKRQALHPGLDFTQQQKGRISELAKRYQSVITELQSRVQQEQADMMRPAMDFSAVTEAAKTAYTLKDYQHKLEVRAAKENADLTIRQIKLDERATEEQLENFNRIREQRKQLTRNDIGGGAEIATTAAGAIIGGVAGGPFGALAGGVLGGVFGYAGRQRIKSNFAPMMQAINARKQYKALYARQAELKQDAAKRQSEHDYYAQSTYSVQQEREIASENYARKLHQIGGGNNVEFAKWRQDVLGVPLRGGSVGPPHPEDFFGPPKTGTYTGGPTSIGGGIGGSGNPPNGPPPTGTSGMSPTSGLPGPLGAIGGAAWAGSKMGILGMTGIAGAAVAGLAATAYEVYKAMPRSDMAYDVLNQLEPLAKAGRTTGMNMSTLAGMYADKTMGEGWERIRDDLAAMGVTRQEAIAGFSAYGRTGGIGQAFNESVAARNSNLLGFMNSDQWMAMRGQYAKIGIPGTQFGVDKNGLSPFMNMMKDAVTKGTLAGLSGSEVIDAINKTTAVIEQTGGIMTPEQVAKYVTPGLMSGLPTLRTGAAQATALATMSDMASNILNQPDLMGILSRQYAKVTGKRPGDVVSGEDLNKLVMSLNPGGTGLEPGVMKRVTGLHARLFELAPFLSSAMGVPADWIMNRLMGTYGGAFGMLRSGPGLAPMEAERLGLTPTSDMGRLMRGLSQYETAHGTKLGDPRGGSAWGAFHMLGGKHGLRTKYGIVPHPTTYEAEYKAEAPAASAEFAEYLKKYNDVDLAIAAWYIGEPKLNSIIKHGGKGAKAAVMNYIPLDVHGKPQVSVAKYISGVYGDTFGGTKTVGGVTTSIPDIIKAMGGPSGATAQQKGEYNIETKRQVAVAWEAQALIRANVELDRFGTLMIQINDKLARLYTWFSPSAPTPTVPLHTPPPPLRPDPGAGHWDAGRWIPNPRTFGSAPALPKPMPGGSAGHTGGPTP